ncbi:butyrophilin subfamily 2 member A1-like [Colossoma macropomum]|uniref:butyrophilin subfamily 2 member A1-like n=1 Tax=Colossoma macropomum TaxID=42526 RepID=UPI001863CE0E|nr:butyrophilin subfamily 2 member A1-like [Colossoma macropomum]
MAPLNNKSKKVHRPVSPSCTSVQSDDSMEILNNFKERKHLENKSLLSGFASTILRSISMKTDRSHEPLQEHRLSPRYAEAGDVACDLCKGRKLRAYKSCMTCLASFCKKHIRDHYTVEALQRHLLVEVSKIPSIHQKNAQLKKIIKEEWDENQILEHEIQTLGKENAALRVWKGETPVAADMVLGPDTAHRSLLLSIDGKRVQPINHRAYRLDKYKCILTTEGFSSGRHYWEVQVNREFTTGVTRESAERKGRFSFSPARGYWCLYHFRQSFTALEEPSRRLPLNSVPRVLGVCVDVDEKWVIFFNLETKEHIYTFKHMNFADGEKIYPVFTTME